MTNNNSGIVQCLLDLGLSERESKVYLALLNKHYASAADLQKLSGIPQNKVYEIIGGLVRQGFCLERKVGRKRTFEIIDPELTLGSAFDKLAKRLEESVKMKEKIKDLYATAGELTEPLEYIEVLHGNDIIHAQYCRLVNSVQTEFLGFGRGPYACDTSDKVAEQDNEIVGVLKRGGTVKWVYELNVPDDNWILRDLELMPKLGAGIRIAETLPLKMMVFDRQTLLVAEEEPLSETGELTMSIIKQRTVVNAFIALFSFFWDNSLDIHDWMKANQLSFDEV